MNVLYPPTLFRKKNGWYYALFYDPDRTPKRKWVALHTHKSKEAVKKFARVSASYLEGGEDPWSTKAEAPAPPAPRLSLTAAVARFLKEREAGTLDKRPLSARSVAARRRSLNAFAATLPPEVSPADVRAEDVHRFTTRPELAEWSRRTYHGHVATFLAWAHREGLTPSNVATNVAQPTVTRRAVAYLDPEGLTHLLRTIEHEAERVDADTRERGGRPGRVRWFAEVVRFAVYTGLRLGEICALRWNAVRGPFLAVVSDEHHRTKSGHERTIPLVAPALRILEERRAAGPHGPTDPVFRSSFGDALSEASTSRLFRVYRQKAELPDTLTFHTLRKTCGVILASAGVDIRTIQAILGHSDVRITGQIYTDVLRSSLAAEMNRAFEEYGGQKRQRRPGKLPKRRLSRAPGPNQRA